MDASKINWRVVGAVLMAVGYVAYKNKGLKGIGKAAAKHGTVAAVLGIVAYFGLEYVLNRVKALPPGDDRLQPGEEWYAGPESLPPEQQQGQQPSIDGYATPPQQLRTGIKGPGGMEATQPLGC